MSHRRTNSGEQATLASPFGSTSRQPSRLQFPIAIMLLVTIVSTTCFSMVLLAFRIPEVQGMVSDLFGGTKGAKSISHGAQLRFLMVCYSAPLMLTGITGIVYYASTFFGVSTFFGQTSSDTTEVDDDSPFS